MFFRQHHKATGRYVQGYETASKRAFVISTASISIVPILREYIPIFAPKNPDRDKYELQNKVLLQSNTILENQIEVLNKQNEILLRKKS